MASASSQFTTDLCTRVHERSMEFDLIWILVARRTSGETSSLWISSCVDVHTNTYLRDCSEITLNVIMKILAAAESIWNIANAQ